MRRIIVREVFQAMGMRWLFSRAAFYSLGDIVYLSISDLIKQLSMTLKECGMADLCSLQTLLFD